MATVVFVHAHPDDEAILTGGTMCRLADEGHRVVLICATDGSRGGVAEGVLRRGESLAERRASELQHAASILGVHRLETLGFRDSGMMDDGVNEESGSFWCASVEEVADPIAAILVEEQADAVVGYDRRGGYGHPDHLQVHRVTIRAAELAGTNDVFEATVDRDRVRAVLNPPGADDADSGADVVFQPEFGSPATAITTRVDVRPYLRAKREAMRAHTSQIDESSLFLALPDDRFGAVFGEEPYIHQGVPPGTVETHIVKGA